jgi:hypothetical protein
LGYIFSHRKGPLGWTPVTSIHSELWPRYSPINILRPAKFGPCRFFFRSPCLCRRRRSSEFCDFSGQAIRSCFCSGHGLPSCQSHACTGSVGDHTSPRSIPKSSPCCSYPNPVPKLAKRKVPTYRLHLQSCSHAFEWKNGAFKWPLHWRSCERWNLETKRNGRAAL